MKRVVVGLAVAWFASVSALGQTYEYPSAGSTVVGSVGFIDATRIGFFWSAARGDSVTQTFASPLSAVDRVIMQLNVPNNGLASALNWDVRLNGVDIGDFSVAPGVLGDITVDLSGFSVPSMGGNYTMRIAALNTIPPGGGSHTLTYAGPAAHSLTLLPEPASLILVVLAAGLIRRRA
jgi:hypothetical protein